MGVPGRRLLLPVGFVVLVDDDDRRQVRDRSPRGGAGADDGGAGRPPGPVPRVQRDGSPARCEPQGQAGGHRRRRAEHERVAQGGGGQDHLDAVRGRREPEHRPGGRPGRPRPAAWVAVRDGRWRLVGGGHGGHHPLRATPSCRKDAGRPAQRQAAQPARSIRSAVGPRPLRLANGRRATPGGGTTSTLDDPAADPPAVQLRRAPRPRRAPGPGRRPGPGSRRSCRWPARPASTRTAPAGPAGRVTGRVTGPAPT